MFSSRKSNNRINRITVYVAGLYVFDTLWSVGLLSSLLSYFTVNGFDFLVKSSRFLQA